MINNTVRTNKKLLVVMPVYNAEKYIKKAIESVLNQTFTDFKLVIIDDASTDSSVDLINKFNDTRIKFIQNPINAGCHYSKNVGFKFMESGEYEVYTSHDSDDYSEPNRFAEIMKMFYIDDSLIGVKPTEDRIGDPLPEWYPRKGSVPGHAFYTKKAFEILGYFDNAVCLADAEFWERLERLCRLYPHQYSWDYHHEYLYHANITGNNMILEYDYETRMKYINKYHLEHENLNKLEDFYKPFYLIEESAKNKK